MRSNAQKILLTLFPVSDSERVLLTSSQVQLLVPDLTEGGYRSLLLFLQRKHWLLKENAGQSSYLSLTDTGKRALIAKFPALSPEWDKWQGNWQQMVFLQAPKGDRQFRYLREQLKNELALPLSRGVYVKAGSFSEKLMQECQDRYDRSLLVFSVGQMQLGELRPIISSYYDLTSLAAVYSSISKSTASLLNILEIEKELNDKQKIQLSSVIDRLIDCLTEDPGFIRFYFPGLAGVRQILPQLQKIINL